MKNFILFLVVFISVNSAFAEEQEPAPRSLVSVLIGPSVPTTSGGQGSFVIGARLGTQLGADQWAKGHIGLVLGTTSITTALSGLTEVDSATYIMAEYLAREAFGTGLYFGARAGLALLNDNVTGSGVNVTGTASAFSYAPVLGYEIPIAKNVDIDLDVSWLTRVATTMTFPGIGTITGATGQSLLFLGGVNYHF